MRTNESSIVTGPQFPPARNPSVRFQIFTRRAVYPQ